MLERIGSPEDKRGINLECNEVCVCGGGVINDTASSRAQHH